MTDATQMDPDFPALPLITDEEWDQMTEVQKAKRHTLEIAEAARIFDQLQAQGVDIFEAAERAPTPRMNRASFKQSSLRNLYAGSLQIRQ